MQAGSCLLRVVREGRERYTKAALTYGKTRILTQGLTVTLLLWPSLEMAKIKNLLLYNLSFPLFNLSIYSLVTGYGHKAPTASIANKMQDPFSDRFRYLGKWRGIMIIAIVIESDEFA